MGSVVKNDPDIIRWSTLKTWGKHFVGWFIVYGLGGWLLDVTRYSDHSTFANFLMLVALSVFMAFVTWKG